MKVWCEACKEEHDTTHQEELRQALNATVRSMLRDQRDLLMELSGEQMLRSSTSNLVEQARALGHLWQNTAKRCRLCIVGNGCAHCVAEHLAINHIAQEVLVAMAAVEAWLILRGHGE